MLHNVARHYTKAANKLGLHYMHVGLRNDRQIAIAIAIAEEYKAAGVE